MGIFLFFIFYFFEETIMELKKERKKATRAALPFWPRDEKQEKRKNHSKSKRTDLLAPIVPHRSPNKFCNGSL